MTASRRANAPVWLFNAGLTAVVAVLLIILRREPSPFIQVHINLIWLTALFILGILYPIRVTFRNQTQDASLETIPLVFGILFVAPLTLIAVMAVAVFGTYAVLVRQPAARWYFNMINSSFATALSILAFRAFNLGTHNLRTYTWPAVFTAVVVTELVSAFSVALVVFASSRTWQPGLFTNLLTRGLPVSLFMTFFSITTSAALIYDRATGWASTVFLALTVIAMQTYQRLSERAGALDRLYGLARELGPMSMEPSQLSPVLTQLRGLLGAESLELGLISSPDRDFMTVTRVTVQHQADDLISVAEKSVEPDTLRRSTSPRRWWAPSLLSSRVSSDVEIDTWLLVGDRPIGHLTASGRSNEREQFERSDVRLLEAAGAQLAAAIEKGRLVERLRRAAERDTLTGLANLDSLRTYLETAMGGGPGLVLLLLDIDRFHEINDMLGHDAGDSVLIEVARRLETSQAQGAYLARIGSDQFALAIPGNSGSEVARLAALAVKSRVDGPVRFDEVSADVRANVGIARSPDHGSDAASLLRRAEMAMKAAKSHSSAIGEWEPDFERDGSRRLRLVTALRAALAQGALHVEYQPKLRVGGGEVMGFEALVRWREPELGLVSPVEFVPLAEASGLIGPLTTFVLRAALETCKSWHDMGKPVGISVNISARSLDEPILVGQVAAMLTASGLDPRWLTLEITESSIMENQARALDVLRQLRLLGVRLSIDDFGTGYSSLNQLRALPVHEVKIDRSFVDGVDVDEANHAVVQAVVQLCDSMGLTTVAEGVETAEQAMTLQVLRVDEVQGYFHSRPMSVRAAADWLRSRPTAPWALHSTN